MEKKETELALESGERTLLEGLLYYSSFLLKHVKLIGIGVAVAAVGSVVFSIISIVLPPDVSPLPNRYLSQAILIVDSGGGSDVSSMLSLIGVQSGQSDMNYGQIGIKVLQSGPFLDEIVEKNNVVELFNIQEKVRTNSRNVILNNSMFFYDSKTGTLNISFEDINPEFARDVVNSMVENLQLWFARWEGSSSQQEMSALKQKIDEISEEISRLETEIIQFQTTYGVYSVDQLAQNQASMIADLRTQLMQTEMAINNYSGFSTVQDQELTQLQAKRDSIKDLIRQIERGEGTGGQQMPSQEELSSLAIEYSHLQMSHEIQMRIYQKLKEQYEVQKLTSSGDSAFSILSPAEIPEEKSGPRRGNICMIATVLGFFMSFGIGLLGDLIKKIKNDPGKMKLLKGDNNASK